MKSGPALSVRLSVAFVGAGGVLWGQQRELTAAFRRQKADIEESVRAQVVTLFADRLSGDREDRREAFDHAVESLMRAEDAAHRNAPDVDERLLTLEIDVRRIEIRTDPLDHLARALRAAQKQVLATVDRELPQRAAETLDAFETRKEYVRIGREDANDRFIRLVHADQAAMPARTEP